MSCDDSFTLVTSRRKGKKSSKKQAELVGVQKKIQGEENIDINIQAFLRRVEDAKNILVTSEFFEDVLSCLNSQFIEDSEAVLDIVCYGLGHFTECNIARFQLALLLLFKEKFNAVVYAHDPVFYACEVNILNDFGFFVIDKNEEGKRLLELGKKTLLYCPHCPRQLINNFLWCNWGLNLKNCIIVGNSFSLTIDGHILSDTSSVSYIQKILPYTCEHLLRNNFVFTDIFNNTAIHLFPEDKLGAQEPAFWIEDCEEPVYPDNNIEFICN